MRFLYITLLLFPFILFAQEELPAMSIDIDEYQITKQIQVAKVGVSFGLKTLIFMAESTK